MGHKLNLTNDEIKQAQGGFAALPAGTYGAVIFANNFKTSKNSGNPMFEIDFKITGGQAGIGRKIRGWFVLTPKALFKVVELHKALGGADEGFPYPDKNTPAGEFEFPDENEYLGKEVNIVIDVEEYPTDEDDENGEPVKATRNTFKYVRAYDEEKWTEEGDEDEAATGGLFL